MKDELKTGYWLAYAHQYESLQIVEVHDCPAGGYRIGVMRSERTVSLSTAEYTLIRQMSLVDICTAGMKPSAAEQRLLDTIEDLKEQIEGLSNILGFDN